MLLMSGIGVFTRMFTALMNGLLGE